MSETAKEPYDALAAMDPLRRSALEKCWAYEKHPASTDQTTGVSACSALLDLLPDPNASYTPEFTAIRHANAMNTIHRSVDRLMELQNEVVELTAKIKALDEQVRGDELGEVTLTASDPTDEVPMRIVNIYLGESPLPVGVGTTLSEAIDAMRQHFSNDEGATESATTDRSLT